LIAEENSEISHMARLQQLTYLI